MKIKQLSFNNRLSSKRGFTILEIMISLFLGLLMIVVMYQVFFSANLANKNINQLSELQETGRFAVEMIKRDLYRSGYLGGNINVADISGTEGVTTTSNTTCPNNNTWGRMVEQSVYGLNDSNAGYACIKDTDYLRGDIIVLRYAAPWITDVYESDQLYLRSTLFEGRLFTGVNESAAQNTNIVDTSQETHQLYSHAYYVGTATDTCQGKSIPALFWKTLENGAPTSELLLTGVEHLQIEYGVDLTNNSTPNKYVSADNVADWHDVVVVRVALLIRSECPDNTYSNTKEYELADVSYQPNDNYHRQVFTTSIALRNTNNL